MKNEVEKIGTPIRLDSEPQLDYENKESYNKLEMLKRHNVTFNFADVGCTISIGCKTYCFSDNTVALEEFSKYMENPKAAYEKWNK